VGVRPDSSSLRSGASDFSTATTAPRPELSRKAMFYMSNTTRGAALLPVSARILSLN
jgi:hypothetical protein